MWWDDAVCCESIFAEAVQRKAAKYTDLLEQLERSGYSTSFIVLGVGSKGVPNYAALRNSCNFSANELPHQVRNVIRATISGSFSIW